MLANPEVLLCGLSGIFVSPSYTRIRCVAAHLLQPRGVVTASVQYSSAK